MKQNIKIVKMSAMDLTSEMVTSDIIQAKHDGYEQLAYEWDKDMGPYVTLELEDYDKDGLEK